MKAKKLYLLPVLFVLFFSCDDDEERFYKRDFVVQNASNQEFFIEIYDSEENELIEQKMLQVNSKHIINKRTFNVGTSTDSFKGDSLIIKYNDGKQVYFKCNSLGGVNSDFINWFDSDCTKEFPELENPLIFDNYTRISNVEFQFNVTDEFYNVIP